MQKEEIDYVVSCRLDILEINDKIIAIEVKSSNKVSFRDAENIFFLKDVLPNLSVGLIVYNGTEIVNLGKNIYGIPWFLI